MTVRVRLIGRVAVETDVGRLDTGPLAAARSRRLLAALAGDPAGLSARRLAEHVWANPPATWPSALRGAIATLRASLEPIGLGGSALIETTAGGWALSAGVTTDLADAERATDAAESAYASGAVAPALTLRTAFADVWAEVLLPDDDAEWLEGLRERHGRLVERARRLIADAAISAHRLSLALEQADALLAISAVDETAHRIRIRARRADGDRAGAIEAFERCRSTLADELGIDPAPETVALYLDALLSDSTTSGSLPALPGDGFFGRAAELTAIAAALRRPGRIELIGRGGIGKSRLALHAAHEATSLASGGRYWASLGDLTAGELVPITVAEAVGAGTSGDPVATLVEHLATAGPALLVLDGCELVADAVLDLAGVLARSAPEMRLLLTSRVALNAGGVRIPIGALTGADPATGRSPAIRLLADRVTARGGHLALDGRHADAVQTLCLRCEGIPLALELAATRLTGMAVGDLLDELDADPAGGLLGAMVDQARAALDDEELAVLDRLALIDGRIPLAVVRGLVTDAVAPGRTARLLAILDEAGLLSVDRTGVRWCYGLDDELRRLVLARSGSSDRALDGLADALDAIAPADATASPAVVRDAVDAAVDGFRTLFRAAAEGRIPRERGLDLAFRLHRYWTVSRLGEGRYWLGRLLDGAGAGALASRARFAAGYLGYWAEDPAALPLLRAAADELEPTAPTIAARALIYAAGLEDDLDLADAARTDILHALKTARMAGGGGLIAAATTGVGAILAERGDPAAVRYCADAVAEMGADIPDEQRSAVLANCARLAWQVGDETTARRWCAEAAGLLDGPARIARAQLASTLAALELVSGQLERAQKYADIAVMTTDELELDRERPIVLAIACRVALARGATDTARSIALRCAHAVRLQPTGWASALALEAAAAVLGDDRPALSEALLRSAAGTRAAGSRPAPVSLRMPAPPPGQLLPPQEAVELALEALSA